MNGHDSCVLVTGGFDPIHGGHIDYFQDAKLLSTYLIVGVNSDEWLRRKKGRNFMSLGIKEENHRSNEHS